MPWPEKQREVPLPDWLKPRTPEVVPPAATLDLQLAQYEMLFPRVLNSICKGDTLAKAVRELPIPNIDQGAFFRWVKKDGKRFDLYKEAKEVRAEVYAGRLVSIAEGQNENGDLTLEDVQRSRLNFDIYKWLMERESRKSYGDVKTLEIEGSISVRAALEEGRSRVNQIIDVEAEELVDANPLLLSKPEDDE